MARRGQRTERPDEARPDADSTSVGHPDGRRVPTPTTAQAARPASPRPEGEGGDPGLTCLAAELFDDSFPTISRILKKLPLLGRLWRKLSPRTLPGCLLFLVFFVAPLLVPVEELLARTPVGEALGIPPLSRLVVSLLSPVSVRVVPLRLRPPYEGPLITVQGLPADGADEIRVHLNGSPVPDADLIRGCEGAVVSLRISRSLISRAVQAGTPLCIEVYVKEKPVFRQHFPVAPKPELRAREGEHVFGFGRPSGDLPAVVRRATEQYLKAHSLPVADTYLVGRRQSVIVELPEEVRKDPARFTVAVAGRALPGQRIRVGDKGPPWVEIRPEDLPQDATSLFGRHTIALFFEGWKAAECHLIRYCAPMLEPDGGGPWQVPPPRRLFWQHSGNGGQDHLSSTAQVPRYVGAEPPEPCCMPFPHLGMRVEPGFYAIALRFRGALEGAMSLPFTRYLDAVGPAGQRQGRCAFKVDGPLNWPQHAWPEARRSWLARGYVLRPRTRNSELRTPALSGNRLDPDTSHDLVLIATVERRPAAQNDAVRFQLYVDEELLGELPKDWAVENTRYIPEYRNWGNPGVGLDRFRVVHIGEPGASR